MPHTIEQLPGHGTALELNVAPPQLDVPLASQPGDVASRPSPFPCHPAQARPQFEVRLHNHSTEPMNCRVAVRGRGRDWQARWLAWLWIGGPAGGEPGTLEPRRVSAEELELVLAPGVPYRLYLECTAALDEATHAGDYDFDVFARDASGIAFQVPCVLRLSHPAATWLQYLPAIYDTPEDPNQPHSAGAGPFFSRFLRGFEDGLEPSRALLARLEEVFDPRSAPPDFLPWLATWVALTLDGTWSEIRRRKLIAEAVELYRWRGTLRGLRRYLEIYTGLSPEISDQPARGLHLSRRNQLGPAALLGGLPAHTFVVTFVGDPTDGLNEAVIRRIIEAEKPAHTAYRLRFVRSGEKVAEDGRLEVLDVA